MRKRTDHAAAGTVLAFSVLVVLSLSSQASRAVAAEGATAGLDGKVAFGELKCSLCHSIDSQSIERKSKSEKTKGPDLSNAGAARDAAWFQQFLRKEVANADGKKHEKDFKGTPEQLQQMAQFLASLKTS